ncbi:MAG: hypothetical protein C00003105_00600 [ANME-2 cluster archaeon HR1]|nr:MAG: hypothetical protein C00003105_00600 [ANME-2 cluster archaeon HR1]
MSYGIIMCLIPIDCIVLFALLSSRLGSMGLSAVTAVALFPNALYARAANVLLSTPPLKATSILL